MFNLIAAGATYIFPGGRALKLVKNWPNPNLTLLLLKFLFEKPTNSLSNWIRFFLIWISWLFRTLIVLKTPSL